MSSAGNKPTPSPSDHHDFDASLTELYKPTRPQICLPCIVSPYQCPFIRELQLKSPAGVSTVTFSTLLSILTLVLIFGSDHGWDYT